MLCNSYSYLLLCSKCSQTQGLRTTNACCLTIPIGPESRSGLAGWFWLMVSEEVAAIWELTGMRGPACSLLLVAVDLMFPFFPGGPLLPPVGCSWQARWLSSRQIIVLHNLILAVTYHQANCVIGVIQPIPRTKWESTPEKRTRDRDHWPPSWRLATP